MRLILRYNSLRQAVPQEIAPLESFCLIISVSAYKYKRCFKVLSCSIVVQVATNIRETSETDYFFIAKKSQQF